MAVCAIVFDQAHCQVTCNANSSVFQKQATTLTSTVCEGSGTGQEPVGLPLDHDDSRHSAIR